MKKVIFSAAALMIGAVALGQQTDPAPLLGGATQVVAPKTSVAGANAVEAYQTGASNKVSVAQAGTSQTAFVSQDNVLDAANSNLVRIVQTGEVQPTSGVENAAEVFQSGAGNAVDVRQQGDENLAVANQGQGSSLGTDLVSSNNTMLIQQGTGEQAEYNSAESSQEGTNNFGSILQTYDRSSASLVQYGDENKSVTVQNAGNNLSDGHIAQTFQRGSSNESTITQTSDDPTDDSGRNNAFTAQDGVGNVAKQIQVTIADEGTQGETAFINQGFSGEAIGDRLDNDGGNVYDALSTLDGDLTNDVPQDSFGGTAIQMQTGKMNAAEIHQFGSGDSEGNEAQQNQSGWNQEALIVQNSNGNPSGGNNFAFQDQSNDNNIAAIGQNGFDHKAQQIQSGKRNAAYSVQRGNANLVSTVQTGNDSMLETIQNGTGNKALVVQADGQSAFVSQNAGQYGAGNGGNQANIYQTGPNGDLSLQGVNCNINELMTVAPITPTGFTLEDVCADCN